MNFDRDAYFRRLGIGAPAGPSLDALAELQLAHAQAIPFENLNPLLGWPVSVEPQAIFAKLVTQRRGGWCFEQNTLFLTALTELGFQARGLGARVVWNAPPGPLGPRSHMLVLVELDGQPYLTDVGFGGQTLTGPLKLEPGLEQPTPHGLFRVMEQGSGFRMDVFLGEWKPMYRFGLEEQIAADYAVSSWYLCNHPESMFRKNLTVARAAPEGRYVLRNRDFGLYRRDGSEERRVLRTAEELRAALAGPFGIQLPEDPALNALLETIAQLPMGK